MFELIRRLLKQGKRARRQLRALPRVEGLEERWCPAVNWHWKPLAAGNWSNVPGTNWVDDNGNPMGPNNYPGKPGNTGPDVVLFDMANVPACTLDVAPNHINTLKITSWNNQLTLNKSLTVDGGAFRLTDSSTITIPDTGGPLVLLNLTNQPLANLWSGGDITGANTSAFYVTGSHLDVQGAPSLGVNLYITGGGAVELAQMTGNLAFNTANNFIDVGNASTLQFNQVIPAGQQNNLGGIVFGVPHGPLSIQVEQGGFFTRTGTPTPGVADQVKTDGVVYNLGGTVALSPGTMLNILGNDGNGYSYWQKTNAAANLQVDSAANINAVGTYRIDIGTVQLTAPSGGSADELDGAGLIFGNASNTFLTMVDSTFGTPGVVTV
jgi:hypothetical protein